jgi:hypothetical protein
VPGLHVFGGDHGLAEGAALLSPGSSLTRWMAPSVLRP